MMISEAWLREWVNPPITTAELAERLTMAGLEVKSRYSSRLPISRVVVARVLMKRRHPRSGHLWVCQVDDGEEETQVVCGAANVVSGMKAVLARAGATLGDRLVEKTDILGQDSCGMLCSAIELGLDMGDEGILALPDDAVPGTDIQEYLGLDDQIIHLDLTPNRADCLSIHGLAREVGAINRIEVSPPDHTDPPAVIDETFRVAVEAKDACPRYLGRVIRDIDLNNPAPLWLREKLRRCGLRSVDPVVDVTNYVLLEIGQPSHAFDLDRLRNEIVVRWARKGDKFELLNGKVVCPGEDTLLIADEDGPVAMGGIMGGTRTAIRNDETGRTRNLFLECAFFTPSAIINRSRRHGLATDSAYRYERGVDPQLPELAMARITSLLLGIVGGKPGPVSEILCEQHMPPRPRIVLRHAQVDRLLGIHIEAHEISSILMRLGFVVEPGKAQDSRLGTWTVTAPSWRPDIAREADLIEEIVRLHGYWNIPVSLPATRPKMMPFPVNSRPVSWIRNILTARQYQEVINYSFINKELQSILDIGNHSLIEIANPISHNMNVMRSSLIPGLVNVAIQNLYRQRKRLRLFEIGQCFYREKSDIRQTEMVAALVSGSRDEESWCRGKEMFDFYDIKGDAETLLPAVRYEWEDRVPDSLCPGQSAVILQDGKRLGVCGRLHPEVTRKLDIAQPIFVFELCLETVCEQPLSEIRPVSPYPCVRRDISMIVDARTPVAEILQEMEGAGGSWLKELVPFDIYTGEKIDSGQKSVAMGLIFQHSSRTLYDKEIDAAVKQVVGVLKARFKVVIRGE